MRELCTTVIQAEDVLVDVCLHGITDEYHGMEVARTRDECIKRIVRSSAAIRPSLKKRPLVAAAKNNGGTRDSNSKKGAYNRKGNKSRKIPPLPTFPYVSRRQRSCSIIEFCSKRISFHNGGIKHSKLP